MKHASRCVVPVLALLLAAGMTAAYGGPLRERLRELHAERQAQTNDMPEQSASAESALPAGVTLRAEQAYGSDPLQRFDVYGPPQAHDAPVIVMVHGGGWRRGDKRMSTVVHNKMQRWTARGCLFVSVNYRLLPQADVATQARDVAAALAAVQRNAASWGGDPARIVLAGHSAGAHLAALISASPSAYRATGLRRWLGTISLDSGALDVPRIMQAPHMDLFDAAFGADPGAWRALSPLHALQPDAVPMLLVCSSKRRVSCAQAKDFAAKAKAMGVAASVLAQDLSHRDINDRLGLPGAYTDAVEGFMASLNGAFARR